MEVARLARGGGIALLVIALYFVIIVPGALVI